MHCLLEEFHCSVDLMKQYDNWINIVLVSFLSGLTVNIWQLDQQVLVLFLCVLSDEIWLLDQQFLVSFLSGLPDGIWRLDRQFMVSFLSGLQVEIWQLDQNVLVSFLSSLPFEMTASCNKVPLVPTCRFDAAAAPDSFEVENMAADSWKGCCSRPSSYLNSIKVGAQLAIYSFFLNTSSKVHVASNRCKAWELYHIFVGNERWFRLRYMLE